MNRLFSFYHPKLPVYLVYMLQQVEYDPGALLRWILSMPRLTRIMYRKELVPTSKVKLLVTFGYVILLAIMALAVSLGLKNIASGIILLLVAPAITILLFYLAVFMAWIAIEQPRRKTEINRAQNIFAKHPAAKIAIAGSYGKTTMKELLTTVLGSELKVAATPGNKNVLISHARWAHKLGTDEAILLIEYGEGAPGDIVRFAHLSQPSAAIVTGLAPNHLDRYKSLEAVAEDLLSIAKFVPPRQLFINTDDKDLVNRAPEGAEGYHHGAALGWKIDHIKVGYEGTQFVMNKEGQALRLHSPLLGRHQVGPLALSVALAKQYGVSDAAVIKSIAEFKPYEHRMEPRRQGGAWIIDDTYNGNLEGIKAGLRLLHELPAKRKIYVTPGLVDQGAETQRVHHEIGKAIAETNPDKTILMQNSVTNYITDGLTAASYTGILEFRDDPLNFYTNMDQYLAADDLWLLQNDWTDNYS